MYKMKIHRKFELNSLILPAVIFLVSSGFVFSQSEKNKQAVKHNIEKSVVAPGFGAENGITSVFLGKAERINSGITVSKLVKTLHRRQSAAYGYVVPVNDLSVDLQNYASGKSQLAKSQEELSVSEKEFERERSLYENKLASSKDYLASKAAYLSDKADVNSAETNLKGLKSRIFEQWGKTISEWIFTGSGELNSLLSLKETLIQISPIPDNLNIIIPGWIKVTSPLDNDKTIDCKFVSAGRLANSQFQTTTLYYIAPASKLIGGMNLKAFLPVGKELKGVIIPSSSIVWYRGKAWVYVEGSGNRFSRVEVTTGNPVKTGFFIPVGTGILEPGNNIVTNGAQLLLSKELLPAQKQAGGDGEDND